MAFDPADLEPLCDDLDDAFAGTAKAAVDPAGLPVPGALVRPDGILEGGLASTMLSVTVILVAPDVSIPDAMVELGRLYGLALPVFSAAGGPSDRATFGTLALPDSPPLPCLTVPLELLTQP